MRPSQRPHSPRLPVALIDTWVSSTSSAPTARSPSIEWFLVDHCLFHLQRWPKLLIGFDVPLRVPVQVALLVGQTAAVVGRNRERRQRQQARRRQDQEAGRLDAVEAPQDAVRQLVVLAAADAVDEQVGEEQAGEQRRRQRPRPHLEALGFQPRPFARQLRAVAGQTRQGVRAAT